MYHNLWEETKESLTRCYLKEKLENRLKEDWKRMNYKRKKEAKDLNDK